jgi:hypothetical protein
VFDPDFSSRLLDNDKCNRSNNSNTQESLRVVQAYGINPKTVAKRKKRTSAASGSDESIFTGLSLDAIIVAFRKHHYRAGLAAAVFRTLHPPDRCADAQRHTGRRPMTPKSTDLNRCHPPLTEIDRMGATHRC